MTRTMSTGSYVLGGASHGAVVWGSYVVVEQAFDTVSPLLKGCATMPSPSQWRVMATAMFSFLLLGFMLGAASGWLLKILEERGVLARRPVPTVRFRRAALLTLALASSISLMLFRPFGNVEAFSLAANATLLVGLVLGEKGGGWSDRLGFLVNPWLASCLMLGGEWTGRIALTGAAPFLKLAVSVSGLLAVACCGVVGSRLWRRHGLPADSFFPARAAAVLALAGALVLGGGLLVTRLGVPSLPPLRPHAAIGRPNVVLVTLDTVRADHLSLYGYGEDTTPFLKQLATAATFYSQATATSNVTLTTHASMFTGLYGSWHGAFRAPPEFPHGRPLSGRYPTLAEILSANGYRTMAVAANYGYLGPGFGLTRGFETSFLPVPAVGSGGLFLTHHLRLLVRALLSADELDATYSRAAEINQAVSTLLGHAAQEAAPFFLFVNYMDAHEPYLPPAPFNALFPGRDRTLHARDWRDMQNQVMRGVRGISPVERRHFVSQYDGAIRYLDSQLDHLISELKNLGLFDNSMIVITSDHGEAFGERNLVAHGFSVYQDQVHVPLIIKYPHQERPRSVSTVVSQVDLMPTVLGTLGFQAPKGAQGKDLRDLEDDASRLVVSESFPFTLFGRTSGKTERAVFSGSTKLIALRSGARELYDLSRDPEERQNLYRPDGDQATALTRFLDQWAARIPPHAADGSKLDADTLRQLKSLGYIQ